jgi:hypothetical protein
MVNEHLNLEKGLSRMRRFGAVFILAILAVWWHSPILAANQKVLLRKIAPVNDIQLRGSTDAYAFSIPIPKRWLVKQATFHFSYVNSSALLPLNSRLVFRIHGRPLAQIRLNPNAPVGEVTVTIPGELLKEGYNPCLISVSQHYTIEECEDPFSPELWTWVNLSTAYFEFELEPVPVPGRVSAIADFLFDARNIFETKLNIVIPRLTTDYTRLAVLAGSGVALRYDYRAPRLMLSDTIRMSSDNIVIGTREELKRLLSRPPVLPPGATIALEHMPAMPTGSEPFAADAVDPAHALIVLSGNTSEELARAVEAFAALSYPFPDSAATTVTNLALPPVERHMLQGGLTPGKTYELDSLGMTTTVLKGLSSPAAGVDLRLPSDLYLTPQRFASIVLHMAYDGTMRSDSVLNIRLNSKFIAGIPLDNPRGDYFKGYKIDIPLSSFLPGTNRLLFQAVMTPLHTDKCTLIQVENLRLIIYEDSTIAIPDVPHWIKMPRVEVFFQDAFPFGIWPDLRETTVLLTDETLTAAGAAINVIALGSQKIGYPPFGLKCAFSYDQIALDTDLLVVGALKTIPDEINSRAPLAGMDPARVTLPAMARPTPRRSTPMDFRTLSFGDGPAPPENRSEQQQFSPIEGQFSGILGPDRAVLMQMQHPQRSERTVMVLTATTAADVEKASQTIWEPSVQATCTGDLVLLDLSGPDHAATSLQVGPSYYLGSPGPAPRLQNLINTHPMISLAVLLVLLMLLCLIILHLLRKRRKQRIDAINA